ncbi:MAG: ABC transporter ATP-binding protein [Acidaminococcaceae bacterium]|uniref:ABC transporter ATP-binding protein n=1 Tax=Succiniclasticum sp. TaxID=2775030 RepID=UPI001B1B3B86|nr:ABC transporter ATP-binding protein [Succiniclasticum sp.]MBO5590513.1 ABC transporter ATP-binding protein [Acidaminococcaceae bacterium]MBP3811828.1 ABC transporter ATP-binding protein [Acidaminococcaceae bacterium]MDY6290888.1 ABC transporter ATP-binding protein [Succiniclasticum sp.]
MAELKLSHIYKKFGKVVAVGDFNIDVADGEFISFLGPSGCGKTTTLRMIAGFDKPTEGIITIGDREVSNADKGFFLAPEKRGIGMVFQSYAVWPHMNVVDNVGYPLKIQNVPKEERLKRVMNMLELVHLKEYAERFPNQLSGGQQQRVALARALVAQPGLLLLDEPLSNLDAKLRESMRFEISAIQKELGITVIYVTHDQSEAMTMSDRIVVMSMGKVQQIGKPYDIYTNPANQMVADFIGLVNFIPAIAKGDRIFMQGSENISFPNPKQIAGNAVLAVRPENITISKTGGMVEGVMHHRFYMGDSVDYRIKVKEQFIRVIQKGSDYTAYHNGDKVFLDFENVMSFENEG